MSEESSKKVHKFEKKSRPIVLSEKVGEQRLKNIEETRQKVIGDEERIDDQARVELNWEKKGEPKRVIGPWFYGVGILFVAFFIGCGGWALWVSLQAGAKEVKTEVKQERLSFEEQRAWRKLVVKKYMEASTWEERARYVRSPDRVIPLMREYYSKNAYAPEVFVGATHREEPLVWEGKVVWMTRVYSEDHRTTVVVKHNTEGVPQVDWESHTVYQPSDWEEFVQKKKADPQVFRVVVSGAQIHGFHGYEFANYRKYRCFKIHLSKEDVDVWGYTEIGSNLDVELMSVITKGGKYSAHSGRKVPLMLEVAYPKNAQSAKCVHIKRLVNRGWMLAEENAAEGEED